MTLKDIVERLERIEAMPLTYVDVAGHQVPNDGVLAAIVRLRLDIEHALFLNGKL